MNLTLLFLPNQVSTFYQYNKEVSSHVILYILTDEDSWVFKCFLDESKRDTLSSDVSKNSVAAARDIFRAKTSTGQDKKDSDVLNTIHENVINCIRNASSSQDLVTVISASSYDGKLVIWKLSDVALSLGNLKL